MPSQQLRLYHGRTPSPVPCQPHANLQNLVDKSDWFGAGTFVKSRLTPRSPNRSKENEGDVWPRWWLKQTKKVFSVWLCLKEERKNKHAKPRKSSVLGTTLPFVMSARAVSKHRYRTLNKYVKPKEDCSLQVPTQRLHVETNSSWDKVFHSRKNRWTWHLNLTYTAQNNGKAVV